MGVILFATAQIILCGVFIVFIFYFNAFAGKLPIDKANYNFCRQRETEHYCK